MTSFRMRLIQGMQMRGMRATDLASATGISTARISQYVNGVYEAKQTGIYLIAKALDVNEAWLMGYDVPMERGITETDDTVEFRVMGEMAAGYDHIMNENWEGDTIEIPRSYLKGRQAKDFIVLSVVGDSMYPTYQEGDRVLIKKCETVPSGSVALFRYDGENATLKRVEYVSGQDWVKLVPINPMHPPVKIDGEELTRCSVIGKPVCLIRQIDEDY